MRLMGESSLNHFSGTLHFSSFRLCNPNHARRLLSIGIESGDKTEPRHQGRSNELLQQRLHVISSFHSSRQDGGTQIDREYCQECHIRVCTWLRLFQQNSNVDNQQPLQAEYITTSKFPQVAYELPDHSHGYTNATCIYRDDEYARYEPASSFPSLLRNRRWRHGHCSSPAPLWSV